MKYLVDTRVGNDAVWNNFILLHLLSVPAVYRHIETAEEGKQGTDTGTAIENKIR